MDQRRIENLVRRGSATQAELDDRNTRLEVATENVQEASADIQETRAAWDWLPTMAILSTFPSDSRKPNRPFRPIPQTLPRSSLS